MKKPKNIRMLLLLCLLAFSLFCLFLAPKYDQYRLKFLMWWHRDEIQRQKALEEDSEIKAIQRKMQDDWNKMGGQKIPWDALNSKP